MTRHGPTVILGLGTRLMGDGGVGLALLDHVREHYDIHGDVLTLDGEAWDRHLPPLVGTARRLILLLALDVGQRPGTLVELEGRAVMDHLAKDPPPQWCQVCGTLEGATLAGRDATDVVAIGVQPGPVALGLELSPAAESAVDAAAHLVTSRLAAWGVPCEPRVPAHA